MRIVLASRALFVALLMWGAGPSRLAAQAVAVDLHLVLAVDVSWSMDPDEQRLQRDGYVQAFRDPAIHKAITSGQTGRIAATYYEWAGADIQFHVIPWTIIDGPTAAIQFAGDLSKRQISRHRMTSISSALQYARRLFDDAPGDAPRRVVDVSGDGPNNSGPSPVTLVRDALVAAGIVINGLPIMLKSGDTNSMSFGQDIPDLDIYYSRCVTGGLGSFMIPIRKSEEFATATRQKLLQEISALGHPRIQRVQFTQPLPSQKAQAPYDCEIGERNWRSYYLDRGRY
jgi:hypothetical protein